MTSRISPEVRARLDRCRTEDERNAVIADVFRQLDETQREHNARPESYPPLWHGVNPLSPLVWMAGYVVVSAVWIIASVNLLHSLGSEILSFVAFTLGTIVFCGVYAAQRPKRWRQYGLNPNLRAARDRGWHR
jgi:hypothetical protein